MALDNSVLFTKYDGDIKGVIHYSDYDKEVVYRSLYQNIYNFENSLRDFLTSLGLRDNDLEGYYNYQIDQCGDEKGFYKKQLNKLKNDIARDEYKKYKNFQKQDFGDLILFTASSYHKIKRGVATGFEEINAGKIAELRNIVMHARDFIGNAPDIPYNFKTFNKFFRKILEFKEAFSLLNNKRRDQTNDIKNIMNKYTLSKIEMMGDVEIFNYFMNKY